MFTKDYKFFFVLDFLKVCARNSATATLCKLRVTKTLFFVVENINKGESHGFWYNNKSTAACLPLILKHKHTNPNKSTNTNMNTKANRNINKSPNRTKMPSGQMAISILWFSTVFCCLDLFSSEFYFCFPIRISKLWTFLTRLIAKLWPAELD